MSPFPLFLVLITKLQNFYGAGPDEGFADKVKVQTR